MTSSPYEFGWSLLERDELLSAMTELDRSFMAFCDAMDASHWQTNYSKELFPLHDAVIDVMNRWEKFKKLLEK